MALRRAEGCITVEMEAAALLAVARFRGVRLGQILYAGDSLAGEVWDHRDWVHAHDTARRSSGWQWTPSSRCPSPREQRPALAPPGPRRQPPAGCLRSRRAQLVAAFPVGRELPADRETLTLAARSGGARGIPSFANRTVLPSVMLSVCLATAAVVAGSGASASVRSLTVGEPQPELALFSAGAAAGGTGSGAFLPDGTAVLASLSSNGSAAVVCRLGPGVRMRLVGHLERLRRARLQGRLLGRPGGSRDGRHRCGGRAGGLLPLACVRRARRSRRVREHRRRGHLLPRDPGRDHPGRGRGRLRRRSGRGRLVEDHQPQRAGTAVGAARRPDGAGQPEPEARRQHLPRGLCRRSCRGQRRR